MSKNPKNMDEPKYEYLDHTADVQIHAWGDSLEEVFQNTAVAMYGYMTDIETVEEQEPSLDFSVDEAEDLTNLLYRFLDELLFNFCAEPFFIGRRVEITAMDQQKFTLSGKVYGETFDLNKHPQGTEVKAITYSAMQIYTEGDKKEAFVIVDI